MEKGYNQELSEKTYFLNICFAFEIYHKTNVSDQKHPIAEFKKLKDYFKKTIKDVAAKDWINSKLGLGNFPSFKDRLVHFKNELGATYYLDAETLINRIIHTRNSLVHSSSKSKYTITDDFELYLISITLETVIKGAILTKLGVESENVLKIYSETKRHIDHLVKRNNSEWLI
jgi:hypothetical protein